MSGGRRRDGLKFGLSAICGALSVFLEFIVVPLLFSIPPLLGFPDFVWMLLRVLLPIWVAVMLLRRRSPVLVWLGLPVQYLTLFVFAEQISDVIGMPLVGMGGFAYLFEAASWPFGTTLLQFLALAWCKRRENEELDKKQEKKDP